MHPINKKNFGNTAGSTIQVQYNNGTSTVTGYIVKQTGTSRYVVTSNGVVDYTVTLASTTALATALTSGYATVVVTNPSAGTEYASKITEDLVYTTAGHVYPWVYSNATSTQATLAHN
jgi:hypothetical protein